MRHFSVLTQLLLATCVAGRAVQGPHPSGTTSSLLSTLQLRELLNSSTNISAVVAAKGDPAPEDEWQLDSDPEDDEDDEPPTLVPIDSDPEHEDDDEAPPLVPGRSKDSNLTPEQEETLWCKFKSRGYQLTKAMMMNDEDAAKMLAWPYTQSRWDGDLRDELKKWGYKDDFENSKAMDRECDFDKAHEMKDAFEEIEVDTRSAGQGGPNHCFYVAHNDGPSIHLDADGDLPDLDEQRYSVEGKDYRATAAYAKVGINRADGLVYFLHRQSPEDAAQENWGYKPKPEELPALRASSDITWGMWNRVAGEPQKLNYIMAISIINDQTNYVIERILEENHIATLPKWPGTDFEFAVKDTEDGERKELDLLRSEAALALLGSPNGLGAGYFLIQHRQQLGRKHFWKVRVWESGEGVWANPNMLFYVTDRNPWGGSDPQQQLEQQMDDLQIAHALKRRRKHDLMGKLERNEVLASNDGTIVGGEHAIRAKL